MGLPKNTEFDLFSVYPSGEKNLITDVPGVLVGHTTYHKGDIHTGVTAVLPRPQNWFHDKVIAGARVLNGYGKTAGLIQVEELGTIESPILMTNTLSVGTCLDGMIRYMLERNPDICNNGPSINCVVTECNDGILNDTRGLHLSSTDVFSAVNSASDRFEEGAVGGGSGMVCMGLKGGIGSASRIICLGGHDYTVGGLVMTNFGGPGCLVVGGRHIGAELLHGFPEPTHDRGSIIMILATDIPLSSRQCCRFSLRSAAALGRVGSTMGSGSGDIAIAFSTANHPDLSKEGPFIKAAYLADDFLDAVFTAGIEAIEESIISSLWHSETTTGKGVTVKGFREVWKNRM